MVVVADFPVVTLVNMVPGLVPGNLHTRSRGQVLHHPGQVVAVGVTVAEEEDVLVVPAQSLLALGREGQARGLDLAGRPVSSGGKSLV